MAAGGGVTAYNASSMGFGRAALIEAIGTAILVFVIFGVIDHRAVPGWAPMAIGAIVFAIIIVVGPATGAAINPARYLGAMFMQSAFGGTRLVVAGCPPTSSASWPAASPVPSPTSGCPAPAARPP